MSDLIDQVEQHLTGLGLRSHRPEAELLMFGLSGANTPFRVVIRPRGPLLVVLVPGIAVVPERRLPEMLRLVNSLNAHRVFWGAFWIEPESRELAFELATAVPGGISREQVETVLAALGAVDAFFPAFAKVLWAGLTADQALTRDEGNESDAGPGRADDEPDDRPRRMAI